MLIYSRLRRHLSSSGGALDPPLTLRCVRYSQIPEAPTEHFVRADAELRYGIGLS
jgi:hypothetical protein